MPTSARNAAHVLHLLALGVWLGVLIATGAFAAVTFPLVRDLAPVLPSHAAYTGEHWRLVAGRVANRAFGVSDSIQMVCIVVSLAAGIIAYVRPAGLVCAVPRRGWSLVILGVATLIFLGWIVFLRVPMAVYLDKYWMFAERGNMESAAVFQGYFAQLHPYATNLLVALTLLVLSAFITAAWPGRGVSAAQSAGAQP
ncbi:hypothetical protein BH11PLA1_BH11PLA1_06950 [soil metagenome]